MLLSWAVPKGPSLDPSVKRLAMHVEDHPIEYGEFEGVIPEGYGAGIVMLWDRGTWAPEVDDIDAALKKGDLKFRLDGYKLKGSWVLVRTKGPAYAANRSWLLIKHRDDWAGPIDIAEFAPLSVKSGALRRHPRLRYARHLDLSPARQGRRDREDVRGDHTKAVSLKTARNRKSENEKAKKPGKRTMKGPRPERWWVPRAFKRSRATRLTTAVFLPSANRQRRQPAASVPAISSCQKSPSISSCRRAAFPLERRFSSIA